MKTARPFPRTAARQASGFTLVELLAALGLAAVVVAFAVPSFASMAQRQRVETLKDHVIGAIQLARTEAVRLGETVVLRRVTPCPEATSNGDWRCGWRMFADRNDNQVHDEDETVLQNAQTPAGVVLRKAGAVEAIRPEEWGDQFMVLANESLYDPKTGLTWDNPTFITSSDLVI